MPIHPTAIVDPQARIAESAEIGPYCVIGAEVEIGPRSRIAGIAHTRKQESDRVAGAAREHWQVLIVGLMLSIALMGLAANLIAKLLHKYPWISYAGVFIVLFVAFRMIWDGFERLNAEGGMGPILHAVGAV